MLYDEKVLIALQNTINNLTLPAKQLQENYLKVLEPLFEIQKQYNRIQQDLSKAFEPLWEIQKQYNEIMTIPLQQISQSTCNVLIQYQKTYQQMYDTFSVFNAIIADVCETENFQSVQDNENDDYVILDESPIKEFTIPNDLIIQIGHNRIRISTSFMVSIISILISVIICSLSPNAQQQKEQTQILYNILQSMETSNSSQKEYFEDVYSALQDLNSNLQEDEGYPDSDQTSIDNTSELTNIDSENQ